MSHDCSILQQVLCRQNISYGTFLKKLLVGCIGYGTYGIRNHFCISTVLVLSSNLFTLMACAYNIPISLSAVHLYSSVT